MTETKIIPNVEFLFTPVVNYSIQQNKVPLVRKLSVENLSEIKVNADLIQKLGADIDTSITKRTNFVIAGSARRGLLKRRKLKN
ncbi:BRCT domain-containing protein [Tangfeifania diversioriginum]|nr:BRCT domain-containing protein [Tangfeifania diversioriginum]